jgi:hypothetical protein
MRHATLLRSLSTSPLSQVRVFCVCQDVLSFESSACVLCLPRCLETVTKACIHVFCACACACVRALDAAGCECTTRRHRISCTTRTKTRPSHHLASQHTIEPASPCFLFQKAAATRNVGAGAAGIKDRAGGAAGHAKFVCPLCKMQAPSIKNMQVIDSPSSPNRLFHVRHVDASRYHAWCREM